MFSNGRKTIGLMIFNTYADFQSQICWGMAERAEQLGYNLAIISSYGSYGTYQEYYQGEMMIFDLPSYDEFAGIVVAFDTFNIPAARDRILEHIQEEADCPVVSLRERLVGVNNILIDEHHSMEGVIRHIVEEHGKKDIAFMTGHQPKRGFAVFEKRWKNMNCLSMTTGYFMGISGGKREKKPVTGLAREDSIRRRSYAPMTIWRCL